MFLTSVHARLPWFGETPLTIAGWMTGGSTLMAKHWYREGAFHLRGAMYWEPASIERPDPANRTPYVSYPSGALVPLHVLSWWRGREPDAALASRYNLMNQWLIAMLLSLSCLVLLRRAGYTAWSSLLLAAGPFVQYVYLPISYHGHLLSYFADSAVLLPIALVVFLEVCRDGRESTRVGRALSLLEGLVAFWGMSTDWLFAFVGPMLLLVRFLRGQLGGRPLTILRRSALFSLPYLAAVGLFAAQVFWLGAWDVLLDRFLMRTGVTPGHGLVPGRNPLAYASAKTFLTFSLDTHFWKVHFPAAFGPTGVLTFLASAGVAAAAPALAVLVRLARRLRGSPQSGNTARAVGLMFGMAFVLTAACLVSYQVFQQHNNVLFHRYAAHKFALPLAVVPWVLLPAGLWRLAVLAGPFARRWMRGLGRIVPVCVLALACWHAAETAHVRAALLTPEQDLPQMALGKFIGANTKPNDIVFSAQVYPWASMPQFMHYAMKELHPAASVWDLYVRANQFEGDWRVVLISQADAPPAAGSGFDALGDAAALRIQDGPLKLAFMPREAFLNFCRRLGVGPVHSADTNGDGTIDTAELDAVKELFLADAYHCVAGEVPQYVPGPGALDGCIPHAADFAPPGPDGRIGLSELLRVVQLRHMGDYRLIEAAEGHFAP